MPRTAAFGAIVPGAVTLTLFAAMVFPRNCWRYSINLALTPTKKARLTILASYTVGSQRSFNMEADITLWAALAKIEAIPFR
jgi:hypothetical protein